MCRKRVFIIFSIMFLGLSSFAEIPPLSQELREEYSTNIISGIVISMKRTLQERSNIADYVYDVTLAVTEVEKGHDHAPKINFTFWKAVTRPDDWCGPGGQHGIFKLYDEIRVYLQKDDSGNYKLIMPNGFDIR